MAAELVIAPEVEQDIHEAYDWYEERRSGLGAIVHEKYRRALVRRFPYAVFYEYENETVTMYCVFHTARDPAKWRSRLT